MAEGLESPWREGHTGPGSSSWIPAGLGRDGACLCLLPGPHPDLRLGLRCWTHTLRGRPTSQTPRGCTGSPGWAVRGDSARARAVHLREPVSPSFHVRRFPGGAMPVPQIQVTPQSSPLSAHSRHSSPWQPTGCPAQQPPARLRAGRHGAVGTQRSGRPLRPAHRGQAPAPSRGLILPGPCGRGRKWVLGEGEQVLLPLKPPSSGLSRGPPTP